MKELTRQGEGVGHCACPVATSDSASQEGQGTWLSCPLLLPSWVPGGTVASNCQGERASIPSLVPRVLLFTDLLPWTEVAVDFSSYSFLRLRWQDKVLGGKPNSRLQGCHFLILTETNPKTEDAREEGKTQKACGSRSHGLLSLGSNIV